jgi:ketosteroid isomerase-like protein
MNLIVAAGFGLAAPAAVERLPTRAPHALTTPREGRMEDRQVAALTEMMDSVNAGDANRYARLYAPDAVITIFGGGVLKGRGAIEEHEIELLREFPGARLGFYAMWQKGPLAVVHYAVNGRTPSGQAMGHEGLLFYRFRPSGPIAEEHRYMDSLTPMAQLGMFGPLPARPLPTLPSELKAHVAQGSPKENENVALARGSLAALDSKNQEAFLSSIAEDAVLEEMIDQRPFVGKRNVKAWFETWTGAVPDARFEITTIIGIGEFVLMEMVVHGRLNGSLGPVSASNREFAVHRAVIVQVQNGKLTRIWGFMNGKELAEAVGQWPLPVRK